jgi:hypothetical protein
LFVHCFYSLFNLKLIFHEIWKAKINEEWLSAIYLSIIRILERPEGGKRQKAEGTPEKGKPEKAEGRRKESLVNSCLVNS